MCDPIDGSPPGSPVPGILQARTLEWVAISFSNVWKWSRSVMSDSLRPHGLQPTRLLHPWDFPGKSTGVGCHCLLRSSLLGYLNQQYLWATLWGFLRSSQWLFPGGSDGKESACNARDPGSIPGSQRSLGEGNGNPLQFSCLENSTDTGAWQAIVHGVAKHQTQLSH